MSYLFLCLPGKRLFTLMLLLLSAPLFAQNLQLVDKQHAIPNLNGQIEIDGILSESQWQQAQRIELNFVTRPSENTAPPIKTEVLIFEDGETLYVAFKASDPKPEDIRAHYRDRDSVWNDDIVGIVLDTFNDRRLAYEFFVNAHGIQIDAIQNEMIGEENDSWDAIWQSAGTIDEQGYQVEIAIPLRIMNFVESTEQKTWAAEFLRFYPRQDRLRISNLPQDRNNACYLCQIGEINGFKEAKQGKNLAIVPSLVTGKSRSRNPTDDLKWQDADNTEVGLDLKWGITPEVSLQATLNPDFSQVEADSAQLSINNTFALFFNEKRPFFLENADYFSSNFDLVYTRNINAPDYGTKVTGRMDEHTFGLFVANDEQATFLVPGNLGSSIAQIDEKSTNMALRYRYDVSDDLAIGWTNTVREAGPYHNYVYGFDSKYQISAQDTLKVQLLKSDTAYPEDLYKEFCANNCENDNDFSEAALRLQKYQNFSDTGYRINYNHDERNWDARAMLQSRGADFRTDLGFGPLADHQQKVIGGGYNWYNEKTWWNKIRISGDWDISHNDAGELLEQESEIYLGMQGQLQSYFELGYLERKRVGLRHDPSKLAISNNTTLFNERFVTLYGEFRPISPLYLELFVRLGDEIDFDNNRLGRQTQLVPSIGWNIGQHLQINLTHVYKKLEVQEQPLFSANLSDLRITYQFDQRQFLRFIAIYSDIERNPDLYAFSVDKRSRDLSAQLLYSYKVNPLTKFFVGYSNAAQQNDVINSLTNTEHSVFMKFSYAWLN
ncbi:carbohydrate binding family 9 domain-containing protein [Paraglaciecola hydrolytica]|uniref:Uncharacterized protein n=1 Tax=Paraglaciecola hydrolytica TaxID=1799789 RepID=A0A136A5Q8_9ALTE|nr:carbohydrate binding family 9 domain-containing protein [Paraglaciecola hydrolytica]KXI30551.1 hypothetical protein AX660_09025 [Paraglaciecola hydrolytica]